MVSGGFKKVLGGVLLWAAISFSAVLVDRVVASVNSEPLLESDVKLGALFYGLTTKEQIVQRLVENTLLHQFLLGRGLQINQELVDHAIQNIATANGLTVEGLVKELTKENLTLEDLRRFLAREIMATNGLQALLEREISVLEMEVELERLKGGEVKRVREIYLLVVDKRDEDKLKRVFDPKGDLEEMAKGLGAFVERLKISKGDLVEALDKEVWQASVGQRVIAEDKDHIYIARVVSEQDIYQGRSLEEIREELLLRKREQRRQELLERLRKNSFVKILQ
ncbi:MAG: peptidylprolyl isomerase [Aquificaceae bacterium]